MDDTGPPPRVLVHCGWPGDLALVCRMLASLGAECHALGPTTDLPRLVVLARPLL